MKKILLELVFVLYSITITAQTIHHVPVGVTSFGIPGVLTLFRGELYFVGNDGSGEELWACDANGTATNRSNNPSLIAKTGGGWQKMAVVNNELYFNGDNGISGEELYAFDGTNPPRLVKDLVLGKDGSYMRGFTVLKDIIYFSANATFNNPELYAYNTITDSIYLVKELEPGFNGSAPVELNVINDKLYFVAYTKATGRELFAYDPVKDSITTFDIMPGIMGSNPMNVTKYNNKLYFSAEDPVYGIELFSLDTVGLPIRLLDLWPGNGGSFQPSIENGIGCMDNFIYFCGNRGLNEFDQLYRYDTATGSVIQAFKFSDKRDADINGFITYHNKLYFTAKDSASENWLYSYHPSRGAEKIVKLQFLFYDHGVNMIVYNDWLYMTANTIADGVGVYRFNDNDTASSVQAVGFKADVIAYPNPASNEINIKMTLNSEESLSVSLYDLTGKQFYNSGTLPCRSGDNTHKIDLSNYPSGQYFYVIVDNSSKAKFVGKISKL